MTKKIFALLTVLLALGFATQTHATCSQYGKVKRVYAYNGGSSNYNYFYITPRTTTTTSYMYYVYVSSLDGRSASLLNSAANSGDTVLINGSISTCPTTGTFRYMGQVNYSYKFTDL